MNLSSRLLFRSILPLFVATVVSVSAQDASDPAGRWEGAILIPGQSLGVVVTLTRSGERWSGSIDIPQQGAQGVALEKISVTPPSVTFAIAGIPGAPTFEGRITHSGDSLTGDFRQGGGSFPFALGRRSERKRAEEAKVERTKLDSIRAFIREAMTEWRVPGVAVAIVRKDSVLLAEGFGERDVAGKLPVTERTLFAIGSSTKAFTAFVLGTLVAEGTLEWDKPVIEYMPEFRLKDPVATEKMTPRDLLNHLSGLPRHDLLWYGSSLSRAELFERLPYLEPTAGFREKWQYQNLMYMTAGVLAEHVSGKSWETLVAERIFTPLGMTESNFRVDSMKRAMNRAIPYELKSTEKEEKGKFLGGRPEPTEYRNIDAVGPAGAINSTVTDMTRWVMLHLGKGRFQGKKILDESTMKALHEPKVVIGSGSSTHKELLFDLYAQGWMVHAYRGRRVYEHGGNIDGFSAMVSFLPDDDLGVVILTNMDGTPFVNTALYTIYDRLLGYNDVDWNGSLLAKISALDSLSANGEEDDERKNLARVEGTRPSHRLADYAGEYENPGYGRIVVRERKGKGGGLEATYNGITLPLEHFHYDLFEVKDEESYMNGIKVMFRMNSRGHIASLLAPFEISTDDILFERRPPASLYDAGALKIYVGEYMMDGKAVSVSLEGKTLTLMVPDQPLYRLVPYREHEFSLKGIKGYSVRFEVEDGTVTAAHFIQPNGTFTAKRK